MLTLGLDTASHGCRVVLVRDGAVVAQCHETMERGQDSRLLPLVQDVLNEAHTDFTALDRIAVLRGPGSFTGLRIGLAAAQGLGAALQKPVLGFDRFSLYRHALTQHHLLVAIDSKRDEVFYQLFAGDTAQPPQQDLPPVLINTAQTHNATVAGDCLHLFDGQPFTHATLPEPEIVIAARLATTARHDDQTLLPLPLYIRAPDVSQGPIPAVL